jgi:uncharacterized protein (DUF2062 family)
MPVVFERGFLRLVKDLLLKGISPRKIALSLACGVVFGLFPIMGSTTILCTGVALALGLNLPAIQTVNFLIYPVQLALILPFIRAGQMLFGSEQTKLTLQQMIGIARGDAGHAFHLLWRAAIAGIAAWTIFAPVALALLYWAFLFATLRTARALKIERKMTGA